MPWVSDMPPPLAAPEMIAGCFRGPPISEAIVTPPVKLTAVAVEEPPADDTTRVALTGPSSQAAEKLHPNISNV